VTDAKQDSAMNWQVYIILCSDDSLYTGITIDAQRRIAQHIAGAGAKYFRGRQPRCLVYLENNHERSSASRREAQIKKLRREDKQRLIASSDNQLEKR
jgi:putative endonuclease